MPKSPNFELNHRQKRVRLSWPGGWVSNFALESIFQMNVECYFTTSILDSLNISKYLARYGIQMDPSVIERRQQSGKKPWKKACACRWGLLSTIIRRGSELIQKVPIMERLPRRFNIVEHRYRQLLHAKSPVPARGVSAIRPGPVFFRFSQSIPCE